MRRFDAEKSRYGRRGAVMAAYTGNSVAGPVLGTCQNEAMDDLKNEGGFIALHLLTIMLVAVLTVFSVISATAFGAKKNATATYMWFGEAMEFAAQAASYLEGEPDDVALYTPRAEQYFIIAFSQMTKTDYSGFTFTPQSGSSFPGPIKLITFQPVQPGYSVPGGIATKPGYVATIDAPVMAIKLPFIGQQNISVPMRYFAVVKSTQI